MLEEFGKWISNNSAQIAVVVPIVTLAGSAAAYIFKLFLDLSDRRQKQFLELVGLLDQPGTLAGKLAAVDQLSRYRKRADKEFLIRLFDNRDTIISGETAGVLRDEMRIAAEKLRSS